MAYDTKNRSQDEIDKLISLLAKLPGFGRRSARRAVLHMVSKRDTLMEQISSTLTTVYNTVNQCESCGNITTLSNCSICLDEKRDKTIEENTKVITKSLKEERDKKIKELEKDLSTPDDVFQNIGITKK